MGSRVLRGNAGRVETRLVIRANDKDIIHILLHRGSDEGFRRQAKHIQ